MERAVLLVPRVWRGGSGRFWCLCGWFCEIPFSVALRDALMKIAMLTTLRLMLARPPCCTPSCVVLSIVVSGSYAVNGDGSMAVNRLENGTISGDINQRVFEMC